MFLMKHIFYIYSVRNKCYKIPYNSITGKNIMGELLFHDNLTMVTVM